MLPIRGFMVHGTSPAYLQKVIAACKRYDINHLELAGDNPTFVDEVPGDSMRLEKICALAKSNGVQTYIWIREFNTKIRNLHIDPSSEGGKQFWQERLGAVRKAFKSVPSLSGGVMSYGSTPTEIWQVTSEDSFWNSKSMADRVRFTTSQFKNVIVDELGKDLFVRDFQHAPSQFEALIGGLKDFNGITMHSKDVPQDWQLFYPNSASIGAYGLTPQVVEMDLGSEYWGQSMIPVSQVEYLKRRLDYDRSKGIVGVVARIDRDQFSSLGTPSELNLFAFSRYLRDGNAQPDRIYQDWNRERYSLAIGSQASKTLTNIYRQTFEQSKLMFYTLGFWAPKDQSYIPAKSNQIDSCIVSKSSAIWDPSTKALERELISPSESVVNKIIKQRSEAVRIAESNLKELQTIRKALKVGDYDDLHRRLELSVDLAKVWKLMAKAYWTMRLAERKLIEVSKAKDAVISFRTTLGALRNRDFTENYIPENKIRGLALCADLLNRIEVATK